MTPSHSLPEDSEKNRINSSSSSSSQTSAEPSAGFFGTLYDYSLGPVIGLFWRSNASTEVAKKEVEEKVTEQKVETVESKEVTAVVSTEEKIASTGCLLQKLTIAIPEARDIPLVASEQTDDVNKEATEQQTQLKPRSPTPKTRNVAENDAAEKSEDVPPASKKRVDGKHHSSKPVRRYYHHPIKYPGFHDTRTYSAVVQNQTQSQDHKSQYESQRSNRF